VRAQSNRNRVTIRDDVEPLAQGIVDWQMALAAAGEMPQEFGRVSARDILRVVDHFLYSARAAVEIELLLSLDRLGSNELNMTQGHIANMLGVRRETVTEAAGNLQSSGIIR
jgi:CRP-like cAMP-binding protein